MFTDPFETLSVFEKLATIALYVTVGVIVLATISLVLVKKYKAEKLRFATTITVSAILTYAVAMLITLFTLKLEEYIADGYVDFLTFIPIVVLVTVIMALTIIGFILALKKKTALPLFTKISTVLISLAVLGIIIANMVKTYTSGATIDVTGEVLMYVFTAIIVAIIVVVSLLKGKKTESTTKSLVYASVAIALSFALSYIRFLELPQGGSITFASLLPLMIYSYMFGIRKGVVAGIIYGFLQFIQAPWFYHPIQFLLDYPIAFAAIGLSGLFKELNVLDGKPTIQFALGAFVGVTLRYASHVISGIFVFGSSDPNYGAVAWSFLYNAFTFADLAICLVAGIALFSSKTFTKLISRV